MLDHKLAAKAAAASAAAQAYKTDKDGNTIVTLESMGLSGAVRFHRYEDLPLFCILDMTMSIREEDAKIAG